MLIISYIAATCTTISFLPQAIQVIKTKNTDGISLSMYIIFVLGVLCWSIYGITEGLLAIAVANVVTTILASIILYNKITNTLGQRKNKMDKTEQNIKI